MDFGLGSYFLNSFNFCEMSLTDIKYDACASLWMQPCTFEELCKRMDKTGYLYFKLISGAMSDGLIYEKGNILYCYKKTAKLLNQKGYELDLKEKSEESEFVKSLRKQGLI